MGLTSDRCLQSFCNGLSRHTSTWLASTTSDQILHMTMRVTGFTFSGGTKYSSNIVRASNVSLVCEIQIAAICLGLTRKCFF